MSPDTDGSPDDRPLIPEIEASFTAAARARARAGLRASLTWRTRRAAAIALVATLAGGTAVAASTGWRPVLGSEEHGQPSVAASSVPAVQTAALGVLRRAQDDGDRGPRVETQLKLLNAHETDGIHVDGVRLLSSRPDGVTVLLPVTRRGTNDPGAVPSERHDVLCVLYGEDDHVVRGRSLGPSGGLNCGDVEDLRAGRMQWGAQYGGRLQLTGLVPDAVARVEVAMRDGSAISVDVVNNYYEVDEPAADGSYTHTPPRWLDGDGQIVEH